ncbi:tetratricopeptide repeat protein [Pedobacter frigiditerrae]|uniref:tetratricopeptide repeat protein n=1 Tax=Pedobacter frigiditerrae TaxID=2530452 RepID=UPI00292F1F00|nr:tetratricopeptide repeat protein [Pedobacter frigiditerrae]
MKNWFCIFICLLSLSQLCLAQGEKGVTVSNKEKDGPTGKTWAVVVGISEYQNISKLNYAHKDAEAFYKYLRTPQVNVPTENIKMLLNKEAISGEIYGTLEWLAESVKENDKVIFYFSGHGDVEKKTIHQNGFLLAYDAPIAAYMTKGTVSIKFLQDYLETYIANNKAKEVLLIVDACKSGKLAGGMEGIKMTMQALGKEWSGQITKILSAQEGELSLENPKWGGGRGVFSYYLMKGIQGLANRNTDNVITAGELALYLPLKVGDETANSQNPKIDGDAKRQLFTFDNVLLADAKKDELIIPTGQMIAANTKKGFADEITPAVADAYAKYNEFVKKGWLLWGEKETDTVNSALHIYNKLLNDPSAITIRPSLKSSFLAALQKRSQSKLDDYLKGVSNIFKEKDLRTAKEIMFAATLTDKKHILHDYIKARALFFNSLLVEDDLKGISILKDALKLEGDAPYIYNRIGLRYADAKKSDSAIYYYNKAVELSPSWVFPYNNLALEYKELKDYKKAIEYCDKAIAIDPNFAGIYNVKGTIHEVKKEYDKAILLYEKSIALDPNDEITIGNLAKLYYSLDKYDLMLKYAQKAILVNPNLADAYNDLGNAYDMLGDKEKSLFNYRKAVSLSPTDSLYINNLAIALRDAQNFKEAIIYFEKLVNQYPNSATTHFDFAFTNYQLKNYEKALVSFDTSIKLDPKYEESYVGKAYVYEDINEPKKAVPYYEMAIKLNSTSAKVYTSMGANYIVLKEYDKAIDAFEKALSLNPKYIYAWINYGNLYDDKGESEKALEKYQRALVIEPTNNDGVNNSAYILIKMKRYDDAIVVLKKALTLDSKNIEWLNRLARVYNIKEDYQQALEQYLKIITIDRNNDNAYHSAGHLYASINNAIKGFAYYLKSAELNGYSDALSHITNEIDKNSTVLPNAIKFYKDSLATNNSRNIALMSFIDGYKLYSKKDFQKAITFFEKSITSDSTFTDSYNVAGLAALYSKKIPHAEKFFNKLIAIDEDDTNAYYNLACLYSLNNDLTKSLKNLEFALSKGYKEYAHIMEDEDLTNLRKSSAFTVLMKKYFPNKK